MTSEKLTSISGEPLGLWAARALGGAAGRRDELGSSDLSIDEVLVAAEVGLRPAGLVSGSAVWHVGYQFPQIGAPYEVDQLSDAISQARRMALERMVASARSRGAAGVLGVEISAEGFGGGSVEFWAAGTALRRVGEAGREPFFWGLLSVQEYLLLRRAGFVPVGVVMGVCVYHMGFSPLGTAFARLTENIELEAPTSALYRARELAMARMQAEADELGASGVVGTTVGWSSHVWGPRTVEFMATGTALRPIGEASHEPVEAAVDLSEPPESAFGQ